MTVWRILGICGLFISVLALPVSGAADDPDEEALKAKELVKSGGNYILPAENEVVDGMKSLRKDKVKLDAELKQRADLDKKIATARNNLEQGEKQHNLLEEKLATVTDPTIHNQIVGQMNLIFVKMKEIDKQKREMDDQASKIGSATKADFVDKLLALNTKAQAVVVNYATLAADPDIKAAVDHAAQGGKHVHVGASPAFTSAAQQLGVWNKDITSESIPVSGENGITLVDVLLNGTPHKMVLDTGASTVTLPFELAQELKLTPGPKDPIVHMKIADGNIIEGNQMTLKTVRVGRFTVENVECVVLQKGLNDAPALLGSTYLSHFVVKLDSHGGTLHLTELEKDDKMVKTVDPGAADAPKGTKSK